MAVGEMKDDSRAIEDERFIYSRAVKSGAKQSYFIFPFNLKVGIFDFSL